MRVYLDNCSFNRPFDDQSQMKNYHEIAVVDPTVEGDS